ncbi:MAG TPA: RodZ domain-containing protein [Geminicoccaceae bacterium]|nr:RodZ domain-containing protein [Geminicoccaceae bacterium]
MTGSQRTQSEERDHTDALMREVGAQLREVRIARGERLEDIAENLRIRPAYLYGLEQGELSVIPGRAYALGFLRSYAGYLGFDGDDLIARIRSSVPDLPRSAHLHGRTPLSESRLPRLPIVVISLAALAGIYAGWTYVDERSEAEVDLVSEVPEDLRQAEPPPEAVPPQVAGMDEPGAEAGPAITPAIAPTPEAGVAERSERQGRPPSPAVEAAAAAAPPTAPPAAAAAVPTPAVQEQAAASGLTLPAPGAGAAPAPAAPAAVEPAFGDPELSLAEPDVSTGEQSTVDRAGAILAARQPAAQGTAPTIYRAGGADGRVILRARSSAWVHVSSTNNDYLWVKTLQPGDAFVVPDRPDLVLWTGNAGGIEVIVDGTALPPLGPDAGVVRGVPLQPQALLRRLAPEPAAGAAGRR